MGNVLASFLWRPRIVDLLHANPIRRSSHLLRYMGRNGVMLAVITELVCRHIVVIVATLRGVLRVRRIVMV